MRYESALRHYLRETGRSNGDRAQGLGRSVLAAGLAIFDLAIIHEHAVASLVASGEFSRNGPGWFRRKQYFFTQALIPLQSAELAARRAGRQLHQRVETLRRHTAAMAQGNRRLLREIVRRKAGEAIARRDREKYRLLLLESVAMQRKLRQLTHQIIMAQEEERKEISRELHDEIVQTLVGINVELSTLGKGASLELNTLRAKIAHTRRLVKNSVNAVHRFARELRPAVLDDLGLIPALHAYSKNLAARKQIKIQMTAFGGVEALGGPKRTVLFRVAQEALTNVARHAQASRIKMTITEISGAIRMEINDNGKSFKVDQTLGASGRKRLGLIGMRERVEMVGGHLTIESSPEDGTTVRAEIPFSPEKNAA